MDGVVAYLLSRKFTKDTVIGMGAIKGAPCQVQSINKVGKTTTITLKWEDNLGVDHTQDFEIEDGIDVSSATITSNGHLELTLSDGNTLDCGKVLPQYDTMPTPSATYNGAIYQYIGSTTSSYTNGYYYKCVNDGGTYKWEQINVQPMPVTSVNGKTGAITLDASDVSAQEIIQYSTMPTASVDYLDKIYQYIGTTDVDYTNGYFYRCELNSETSAYEWVVANQFALAEDVYTKDEIGNLSDLPDNTKDIVENIVAINNEIDEKQDILQYSTLPTPSSDNVGAIVEYIGTTTADYTNGYFYQCKFDGTNYRWVQKDVQPSGGGTGSDNVIEGYFNATDNLFYEEIAYINPIAGAENVIYISLDTNLLYRYDDDNSIFIRVDEHADGQTIQVTTMPTASLDELGKVYQFIGTTTADYTNGYFYKCVVDGSVYSWENINTQDSYNKDDVYTKTEIGDISNLPDDSKDIVENIGDLSQDISDLDTNKQDVIQYASMPIASSDNVGQIYQYLGTTTSNYVNGYFYKCVLDGSSYVWQNIDVQPSSGTSTVDSVNGKTGTVVLNSTDIGFQYDVMPTTLDNTDLGRIVQYIGSTNVNYINGRFYKCIYDNVSGTYKWEEIALIVVDSSLSNTSENPVQNKVIYDALDNKVDKVAGKGLSENDYTNADKTIVDNVTTNLAGKADLAVPSAVNNFATLNSSGNLTDSGINKNIIPSSAASNNQLVTANDISTLTNKANKVSPAPSTNGNIATLDTNGDLTDSGINKNIIPTDATSTDKLAKLSDIPKTLNALSDDVVITNPQNNQIFAYNSTSGKWENKTGQETIGGIVFKGSILFANLPTVGMSNGDAYDIKDAFTTDTRFEEGSGINCGAGTDVVWVADDGKWNILTPSGVYSFNGRTGAVSPALHDYDADQIDYDNTTSGLTATDVQAAIDELQSEKADTSSVPTAYTNDPEMDGTASAGSSSYWAKGDHVHPTDTSRASASDLTSHINNTNNPHSVTATQVGLGSVVNTGDSDTPVSGGTTKFTTGGAYTELNKKADKVANATNGHLASLDGNGNLTDSGVVANDVIQKVATATGLLKDDGSVDTTIYAPSNKAYLTDDTAETTIDDTDYFPFYDTSATEKRKTLFSSIVNKLKVTFATLVTGTFTSGNLVSLDSSGNIADSNISSNDIRKTTTVSHGTSGEAIFKISGFGLNSGSLFVIRSRGGESILFALGNSSQDVAISYGYSAFRISGTSAYKINAMTYDYANNELYVNLGNYSSLSIIQISGVTKYDLTITSVNSIPTTDIYEIPIQNLNSKIDKVSAIQNDIAIFDANGGVADSNVLISSLPTISPTPSSNPTESDIVDAVNLAPSNSANAPSLYGIQQWTNEKKVRRVLNGANIPSGVTADATGIGTWDDTEPPTETDWWYDAAFVVPVYYKPTTDTVIVTGKTYYTQDTSTTPYTYTVVANPVVADIGTYYEQYSDDVEISIKFDPSGDTTVLGGYILDTTTGKICIKFANSIDITKARIAVDLTYTRNEVS